MSPERTIQVGNGGRGASEVVGVVLMLGLVLAGAGLVFLTGSNAVQQVQSEVNFEGAESVIGETKSTIRTVAAGEGPERGTLEAPGDEGSFQLRDGGTLRLQVNGRSGCTATRDLGLLTYEQDDRRLAYHATGVWRRPAEGQLRLVSAPDLDYRVESGVNGIAVRSMSFPVANVNRTGSDVTAATGMSVRRLRDPGSLRRELCLAGGGAVDQIDNVTVELSGTEYYRAWERYLRSEFTVNGTLAGTLDTDNGTQTVTLKDVPVGYDDDDDDGYPDPDVPPSEYPSDAERVDNCPPLSGSPGDYNGSVTDTYNPSQRNPDGDRWGSACDTTPYGGDTTAPTVELGVDNSSSTATTVVADYEVTVTDRSPGRIDAVNVSLVDADNGSVLVSDDYDVHDRQVRVSGTLLGSNDLGQYAVVVGTEDAVGNRNQTNESVFDGGYDRDGDGVPDRVDECRSRPANGTNGCLPVDASSDDAAVVNQSSATITELSTGPGVSELVDRSGSSFRPPLQVVFVLDTSGSMSGNDPSFNRIEATTAFLGQMDPAKDKAAAVGFDTGATTIGGGMSDDLLSLGNTVRRERGGIIDNDGGTDIAEGVERGLAQYTRGGGKRVMVLLTDGNGDTGGIVRNAKDKGVRIYAVGLGDGVDGPVLQQIARETGGRYLTAAQSAALTQRFEEIAGRVTTDPIRRLERKEVTGRVVLNRTRPDEREVAFPDDLSGAGTSETFPALDNGSRVSLSVDGYSCGNTRTVDTRTNGDKQYNVTECVSNRTSTFVDVDATSPGHEIYRDGEDVPDVGTSWYRPTLESTLGSTRPDLVDGGEFDLGDNQAVYVLRQGDNYAAFLLETPRSVPDFDGGPLVTPTLAADGSGPPAGPVPDTRQFLSVGFTQVVVEDG
jgi:hypothetical protein